MGEIIPFRNRQGDKSAGESGSAGRKSTMSRHPAGKQRPADEPPRPVLRALPANADALLAQGRQEMREIPGVAALLAAPDECDAYMADLAALRDAALAAYASSLALLDGIDRFTSGQSDTIDPVATE